MALLAGLTLADTAVTYPMGHIEVTRTLAVRQIGRIDPGTGAAMPQYESIVTLTVANTGPLDRNAVRLEENLNWLPPHARLTYSLLPVSDGQNARWVIDVLPAGRNFSVWFSLPVSVPDAAAQNAGSPRVNYNRSPALISVPPGVEIGGDANLRLRTADGLPLGGAEISVSTPEGKTLELQTDQTGKASFKAERAGFYTYGVPDYEVGFIPSTESIAPQVVVPATIGSLTPLPPSGAGQMEGLLALVGFWPLALGLVLVAAMAFAIYTYFNTMPGDDSEPMPPAPAVRLGGEESRNGKTDGAGGMSQAPGMVPKIPATGPAGAGQPTAFQGGEAGAAQAGAGGAGAGAGGVAPLGSVSYRFGAPGAGGGDLKAQTRDMLSRRRAGTTGESTGRESETESGEPQMSGQQEEAQESDRREQDEAPQDDAGAQKTGFTEETFVPEGPFDKEDDMEEREPGIQSARAPAWMTHAAAPEEAEETEIDDEAISKTIAELEQLRAELQARSLEQGRGGRMVRKEAPADEARETGENDENFQSFASGEEAESAPLGEGEYEKPIRPIRRPQWPAKSEDEAPEAPSERVTAPRLRREAPARAKKITPKARAGAKKTSPKKRR